MKAGLLSDAHGNAPALAACVRALQAEGAERLYFLGDAVGYFPDADEVISLLEDEEVRCIQGNHEAMLLGEIELPPDGDSSYRLEETRRMLSRDHLRTLAGWPSSRKESWGGRRALLVHGSPWEVRTGYVHPDSSIDRFAGLPYDAVFLGNTHRPFVRKAGGVLVVNVGSVGLPRDDGRYASCVLYDAGSGACEVLRVEMPMSEVNTRYGASVHPSVLECLQRRTDAPLVGRIV